MQIGEVRQWLGSQLMDRLDEIVLGKQDYPVPYYIQVQINEDYKGPSAYNDSVGIPTKTVKTEDKKLIGQRFVMFDCILRRIPNWVTLSEAVQGHVCENQCGMGTCPLNVPQLGCIVFAVDNKKGTCEPVIMLPQDNFVDTDGEDIHLIDESVRKTGVM